MSLIFPFIKINENYFGIFGAICVIISKYSVNLRYYYFKGFVLFSYKNLLEKHGKYCIFDKAQLLIHTQNKNVKETLKIFEIKNFSEIFTITKKISKITYKDFF